jgi:YrbI family 3-deoxy-D-manno-octulosonate 8-phosphate phosphatase
MVDSACAVIVADEASLVETSGGVSLAVLIRMLRGVARVRELFVMTAHARVRVAAESLGVRTIEDQILARVPVDWVRDRMPTTKREPPPAGQAANSGAARGQLPMERLSPSGSTRSEAVVRAAPDMLQELEKYDALLLLNGTKPLVTAVEVDALLDALAEAGTAVLVAPALRSWRQVSNAPKFVRTEGEQFADLEALYGVRSNASDAGIEIVVAGSEFEWDVRQPAQLVAVNALLAARKAAEKLAHLPEVVSALVMDFDGVFTDNAVWLSERGEESVRCDRGDGLGLGLLRQAGLPMLVISKEQNPVVQARCAKLAIECFHGVDEKLPVLKAWAAAKGVPREQLLYVGNDVNDLECLEWAGCGVVVADAHRDVLGVADLVLTRPGGHGALRELADLIRERVHGYFPVVPT